jgi:hypothetical protein
MIDPRTNERGELSGWYRAALFNAEEEERGEEAGGEKGEGKKGEGKKGEGEKEGGEKEGGGKEGGEKGGGGRLVPSNCVRRCTTEERMQARMGRLPIWARLRYALVAVVRLVSFLFLCGFFVVSLLILCGFFVNSLWILCCF